MKNTLELFFNKTKQYMPFTIIKESLISFSIFLFSMFAIYFELNLLYLAIKNTSAKDSIYKKMLELKFNMRGIVEISSFSLLSYFILILVTRECILHFSSVLNKTKYLDLSKKFYAALFISITIFTAFSYEQFTLIATIVSFIAIFLSISKKD